MFSLAYLRHVGPTRLQYRIPFDVATGSTYTMPSYHALNLLGENTERVLTKRRCKLSTCDMSTMQGGVKLLEGEQSCVLYTCVYLIRELEEVRRRGYYYHKHARVCVYVLVYMVHSVDMHLYLDIYMYMYMLTYTHTPVCCCNYCM